MASIYHAAGARLKTENLKLKTHPEGVLLQNLAHCPYLFEGQTPSSSSVRNKSLA